MHKHVVIIMLMQFLTIGFASGGGAAEKVRVADPYLEMHTGAGAGYPVFHVVDRNEVIEILMRKTDWFRIRASNGKIGWVDSSQMLRTLSLRDEEVIIKEVSRDDYSQRQWEIGVIGGDFGGATIMTVYADYAFASNLSLEMSLANVLGNFSSNHMLNFNLVSDPFPEWRFAPFFTLGTGVIQIRPHSILVQTQDRTDKLTHFGLGVRSYITRRFLFRMEYRNYVIFQSRNNNEEVDSWQAGFSFFF